MISQKSHVLSCSSKKSGYKNQNLICRRFHKQSLREEFELITKNPICAKYYQNIISQDLCLKQNYKNIMELASFQQIACNTSSKNYTLDRESILPAVAALEMITGQKPKPTCAKKSISSFKLRQSQLLGCKTSLRGEKMYEFLEKYISIQPTLTEKKIRDVRHNKKQSSDAKYYQGKAILNRGRDYVILNCNVFPELQQHDELFQNVSGIQVSFSIKSRKKVNYKYPNSILLLSSAFQLL